MPGSPTDLKPAEISVRLEALGSGLSKFPASLRCPWPIARVFNELLKQARRELPDDPVMKGIRFLEETSAEEEPGSSNVLTGTVELLVGQVIVALGAAGQNTSPRATVKRTTRKA